MRDVLGVPTAAMHMEWGRCGLGKAAQELFSAGQPPSLIEASKPTLSIFNAFARLDACIQGPKWIRLLENGTMPIAPHIALRSERLAIGAGRSAHSRPLQVLHDAIQGVSARRRRIESVIDALRVSPQRSLIGRSVMVSDAVSIDRTTVAHPELRPPSNIDALIKGYLRTAPWIGPSVAVQLPTTSKVGTVAPSLNRGTKILVAVDNNDRKVLIWGGGVLVGDVIFPILQLLAEMRLEDRKLQLAPTNFRGLVAKQLANRLQLSDEGAVRSAIKRARVAVAASLGKLECPVPSDDILIQSVGGKGYRLHPDVEIISMEEFGKL